MPPKNKTHQNQSLLAEFCRTGNYSPIEGVSEKNVTHYRRLVFNNICDSLENAYPLTLNLLTQEEWDNLVYDFFSTCNIQSPQIWYMPKEIIDFVINHKKNLISKYSFLLDLLKLEWLEIDVFMMPDIKLKKINNNETLYYINPETIIEKMDYPVHIKNAKNITESDKGNYFVSLHRHPETGSVHFTNLSVPFVDLLENLFIKPLSKNELVKILRKYASNKESVNAVDDFLIKALATLLIVKI